MSVQEKFQHYHASTHYLSIRGWWCLFLYQTNTLISQILKEQFTSRHVAPFQNIIMAPVQPGCVFPPQCFMLTVEATCTNYQHVHMTNFGSMPRCTALGASMVTITPPISIPICIQRDNRLDNNYPWNISMSSTLWKIIIKTSLSH